MLSRLFPFRKVGHWWIPAEELGVGEVTGQLSRQDGMWSGLGAAGVWREEQHGERGQDLVTDLLGR